jgi:hypothetical protein
VPADPRAELTGLYRAVALQVEQLAREYEARGALGSAAVTTRALHSIEQAVRRLDVGLAAWLRRNIQDMYLGTIPEAVRSILKAGLPVVTAGFTGHDRRAMRALEARISADLGSIRTALGVGLALGDRRQARVRIKQALEQENELVRLEDGRLSVKVPSGKFWHPDVYAEMLGRTGMADARRVAFRERYLQNGIDVVKVVANGSTHPPCMRWEGELLSLTGATPGLPTVGQARADGLFHPNCAHRYVVATGVMQPDVLPKGSLVLPPEPPLPTLGREARTTGLRPRVPAPRRRRPRR